MPHIFIPPLYIDPTSGSLFIQAVIAAIVVVPFFLRNQIRRAVNRVRGVGEAAPTAAIAPARTVAPVETEPLPGVAGEEGPA